VITDKPNLASAAARTGSGDATCFDGEQSSDSAPAQKYQARILVRRFGVRRDHLRLVPPPLTPRPRRLEVRIAASDGGAPFGRSRIFRLHERDLDQLIDVALRLEARR